MNNDCIFCKIAKGEIPVDFIEETNNFVAFLDKNPVGEGHTLVIPKEHFVNFLDMPFNLGSEFFDIIKKIADKRLKDGAEGFNLLMRNGRVAGQEILHTHLHIIPRKKDDGISSLPV